MTGWRLLRSIVVFQYSARIGECAVAQLFVKSWISERRSWYSLGGDVVV